MSGEDGVERRPHLDRPAANIEPGDSERADGVVAGQSELLDRAITAGHH